MGRHSRPHREDEGSGLSSRDIVENSNERFAETGFGSGFIVPFDPAAAKIFSPDSAVGTTSWPNQIPAGNA
jgi:hypothetical protein